MSLLPPPPWDKILQSETDKSYYSELCTFVNEERSKYEVFPPEKDVFRALELTSYDNTRVLILGQDPYHDNNQAHGLCFSVRKGVKLPPSLRNIFKEMKEDLGHEIPTHGFLEKWAQQGILMLNAVLTVRAHAANSHKGRGWEQFTDAIIQQVSNKKEHVVFVLWGAYAQKKLSLIDEDCHTVIQSAHPSPLSARRGFFGSHPFSRINDALVAHGQSPIDWQLECEAALQPELF